MINSSSANTINLVKSKFLLFGKGLNTFVTLDTARSQYSFLGLLIDYYRQDLFLSLSHQCPLLRRWLFGKAASGLEKILCGVLVKRTPGMHG